MNALTGMDVYLDSLAGKSPDTRRRYQSGLKSFVAADIPVDEFCIEQFYTRLIANGVRHATAITHCQALLSYLRFAVRRMILTDFSLERARGHYEAVRARPQRSAPKSTDGLVEIVRAALGHGLKMQTLRRRRRILRDRAILMTLYTTGLRRSEICGMSRRMSNGEGIIKGKGGHERLVFISPECQQVIDDYLNHRIDNGTTLFTRHDGKHEGEMIDRSMVNDIVHEWGKRAGVSATPHMFRHDFASRALNNGVDLSQLQDLLGHASPETTKRIYAHYTAKSLRAAAQHTWESVR